MKWLPSMSNAHRSRNLLQALRRGILPFGCGLMIPAIANAQSYSPGALLGPRSALSAVEVLAGNPPPFQVDMSASLSGAYTSNVSGTPTASDDFNTRAGFTFNAAAMTAHI